MKRFLALILAALLIASVLPAYAGGNGCVIGEHTMGEWMYSFMPGCTYPGEKIRYCQYCNYYETKEVPALGHWYPDPWVTTVEPTCTEPGKEQNYCKRVIDQDGSGVYYCDNL